MKKTSVMLIHSVLWAVAILLLALWLKESASHSPWLFCAVALWCYSHTLLQYGGCKRRQRDADGLDNPDQCNVTTKNHKEFR